MGDEIPMKRLIIVPLLASYMFASSDTRQAALINEYKNMFEKIGEKRIGVDERDIDALKSPFVKVKKKNISSDAPIEKGGEQSFVLQALLNKSAKINGKWYRLHEKVHGMKIVSIRSSHVWLRNEEFRKKLILGTKNENISIK